MDFKGILSILKGVRDLVTGTGELLGLADGDEGALEALSERGTSRIRAWAERGSEDAAVE